MPLSSNAFIGLPPATLAQLQQDFLDCVTAIAVGNQSYTVNGRQFTRANLSEVKATLAEITQAIRAAGGTARTTAQATV